MISPLVQLDRFLEGSLVNPPRGRNARFLVAALAVALVACAWLLAGSGPSLPMDLFFTPILVALVFFRRQGLWVMPPALLLYHLSTSHLNHLPLHSLLLRDLLELLEWLVLAAFILTTLDRYRAVKRHEARISRDIGLARTLQTALAPPDYDFGRLRIQGFMRQSQDIGGDFYYFRPFQDKYVVFCLGDTMGKGMPASMVMAIIMGFFFEWGKRSPSPSLVLSKLNRRLLKLWGEETTWFATLFYGVFDEETSVLTFTSAGHHAGLLLRASGPIELLTGEGLPVGIFDDSTWTEQQRTLEEGDRVVLFTDGLIEARSPSGDLFTLERLVHLLEQERPETSEGLLQRLEQAVLEYAGGVLSDDLAILVLELKPGSVWEPKIASRQVALPAS